MYWGIPGCTIIVSQLLGYEVTIGRRQIIIKLTAGELNSRMALDFQTTSTMRDPPATAARQAADVATNSTAGTIGSFNPNEVHKVPFHQLLVNLVRSCAIEKHGTRCCGNLNYIPALD